jgi:hypothetical protein
MYSTEMSIIIYFFYFQTILMLAYKHKHYYYNDVYTIKVLTLFEGKFNSIFNIFVTTDRREFN